MGREFELKYRATPQQLEAIRQHFSGFAEIRMETTYYDTPDHALRPIRWTLRRRMENGSAVCAVKTNLPDGSRGEWEVRCDDIRHAIPALVAKGAPAGLLDYADSGLTATCGARFLRLAAAIPAGSSVAELALDQGVLLGGGQELPFAEVEVELKQGTDEDAAALAQTIARRFGLVPEPKSKLARALKLAETQTP